MQLSNLLLSVPVVIERSTLGSFKMNVPHYTLLPRREEHHHIFAALLEISEKKELKDGNRN